MKKIIDKVLLVAHPDDEILWFNPSYFDHIFIVFCERSDKPNFGSRRIAALQDHPLRDRITFLELPEPGYWKDPKRIRYFEETKVLLLEILQKLKAENEIHEIYTHNETGEYGHDDHIMLSNCVAHVFKDDCPIWMPLMKGEISKPIITITQEMNVVQFKEIRKIYIKHKVWTWNLFYLPPPLRQYYIRDFT